LYRGFFRGSLPAHWSVNERAPFVPRLVLTFRQIGDASRNSFTFVHALDVFVSFTPLLSLYKKDCDYVKPSWTKIRCSSSRQPASREGGPNRLFPESLRPGRSFNRSKGPVVTNGPKLWKIFCCSSYQMQGFLLEVYYYRRQICNEIFIHYLHLQTIDLHVYLRTEAIFKI
jgi:hypothetical protein